MMGMSKIFSSNFKKRLIPNIVKSLQDNMVPKVIDTIIDSYKDSFYNIVDDEESVLVPEDYEDELREYLNSFEFIKIEGASVSFICPDIDNIDLPEDLDFVSTILAGLPGEVAEVWGSEYINSTGTTSYGDTMIEADQVYLLEFDEAQEILNSIGEEASVYELSNTIPVDIFSDAISFVGDNIGELQAKVIEDTLNQMEE